MTLPLGRREPATWEHVEKYPLTVGSLPAKPVPVVIGVNWYSTFDVPTKDTQGKYWIGVDSHRIGSVRGGHCVCLKPASVNDGRGWYRYYDQGIEGACVGFGASRMMSLLNRVRYDARWLYLEAKATDGFPDGPESSGTSVSAALDILRTKGHMRIKRSTGLVPDLTQGIAANRWATTSEEVAATLGTPDQNYVEILNSWGANYPRIVRMPVETLQRLLDEGGEAGIVTDR